MVQPLKTIYFTSFILPEPALSGIFPPVTQATPAGI
jgi:hypothetical protein